MKTSWLLLLTLVFVAMRAGSGPVRVTFVPLTEAAYEAAKDEAGPAQVKITRPLKKVNGQIVIPTATGKLVFQDRDVGSASDSEEEFTYLGYVPQLKYHMLEVYQYENYQYRLISEAGEPFTLSHAPAYSPDMRRMVVVSAGIEDSYEPNRLVLYQLQNSRWRKIWEMSPTTWEPKEICWLTNNTLVLQKRVWTGKRPGATYTYAKMRVQ